MRRVLIVDPIAPAGEALLARHVEVLRAPDGEPDTVRRLARDADGIVIRSKLPDDIFSAAPRLRAVAIHGTGIDLVPLEEATARGIMVCNLPGGNAQSVAEYCAMAMLMLARNVLAITTALKQGTWDAARALGGQSREIAGMTLGIVGVGEIGTRLARIARLGFGMRVLGHQRRLDRLPAEAQPSGLAELLGTADFVVLACPLTRETRHLIGREALGRMRRSRSASTSAASSMTGPRPTLTSQASRRIAGAMLDVYEHYRLAPGHPLFALDNAVLTPHLAGMTRESRARMSVAAAEEMLRMLEGQAPRHYVNPPR